MIIAKVSKALPEAKSDSTAAATSQAITVINPGNPVGAVLDREDVAAWLAGWDWELAGNGGFPNGSLP